MTGIEMIAAERTRQVEEEGWSPEHDRTCHPHGEIAVAAAELAADGTDSWVTDGSQVAGPVDMCGSLAKFGRDGSAPDRVRALVIAGALIAAEIDRVKPEEEAELRPCWFCGAEPYVHEPDFKGDRYQIGCRCGADEDSDGAGAIWRDGATWEEVVDRWNRRSVTSAP